MKDASCLTPKQEEVLRFIRERIEGDLPPTIREIAKGLRFSSTGTVRDYLKALERKGFLRRKSYKSRAIELLRSSLLRIPILAAIPAGKPAFACEDIQGYVEPRNLFGGGAKDIFGLRVKGDSMMEAGILEGDIAIIRKQPTAHNGEIVAALLENNEVTLKRFRRRGEKIYLEAANKNYPPIEKSFSVIGTLTTILRKY